MKFVFLSEEFNSSRNNEVLGSQLWVLLLGGDSVPTGLGADRGGQTGGSWQISDDGRAKQKYRRAQFYG